MPVVPGTHFYRTVADVNSRARSILNDDGAQIWTDALLLNHVRDAYTWLYGQVVALQGQAEEVVLPDIVYTPLPIAQIGQEQDLASILPVNFYMPRAFHFRLNKNEEYLEVDRRQKLPARTQQSPLRIGDWEYRGNSILVCSTSSAGLIKLTYTPLLADVFVNTDPILINNALEALAHYVAYMCYSRRGQMQQAKMAMGSRNPPSYSGALYYADLLLDHIIHNEQEIPRRGAKFTQGDVDTVSNRQQVG